MITCNGAAYIAEQLSSVLEQVPPPDELVVSDDASNDGTAERIAELTRDVPVRVNILHNSERLGVSANLQQAIEHSTGDVVLFSDQDDVWKPGKIARVLAEFAAQPDVGL